jgi:hypothetical protein
VGLCAVPGVRALLTTLLMLGLWSFMGLHVNKSEYNDTRMTPAHFTESIIRHARAEMIISDQGPPHCQPGAAMS